MKEATPESEPNQSQSEIQFTYILVMLFIQIVIANNKLLEWAVTSPIVYC